jgi:hypothetical protein
MLGLRINPSLSRGAGLGGLEMQASEAQLTAPRVVSFTQTPVRGRCQGMGHRAKFP